MPYVTVYVDESGNLGFSKRTSQTFTASFVIILNNDDQVISTRVKRLLRNTNMRKKPPKKVEEFKFANDSHETKKRFLKLIQSFDIKFGVIVVDKNSVKDDLKDDPAYLYNYLVVDFILRVIVNEYLKPWDPYNRIIYTIDRSLTDKAIKQFNRYLDEKIDFLKNERDYNMTVLSETKHENSKRDPILQIADYVAGATNAKFEYNTPEYYEMIKNKIKHKEKWDWKNRIVW